MNQKPKIKLRPAVFKRTLSRRLRMLPRSQCWLDSSFFCCLELDTSARSPGCPERRFFEKLFGVRGFMSFYTMHSLYFGRTPPHWELYELRLMALALAHTLAGEYNAGRFTF